MQLYQCMNYMPLQTYSSCTWAYSVYYITCIYVRISTHVYANHVVNRCRHVWEANRSAPQPRTSFNPPALFQNSWELLSVNCFPSSTVYDYVISYIPRHRTCTSDSSLGSFGLRLLVLLQISNVWSVLSPVNRPLFSESFSKLATTLLSIKLGTLALEVLDFLLLPSFPVLSEWFLSGLVPQLNSTSYTTQRSWISRCPKLIFWMTLYKFWA